MGLLEANKTINKNFASDFLLDTFLIIEGSITFLLFKNFIS